MSGGFCPFGHVPISSPTDPRKLRGDRNGIPKRPELITDKALRAWLRAGPVDRGIGDGLTFVASAHGAAACKASWVLRFRFGGAAKEKVLGRYPDLSLAQAREKARSDRALIQQDIDVAAGKRLAQLDARRTHSVKTAPRPTSAAPNTPLVVQAIDPQRATVCRLVQAWLDRYIPPRYKHPDRIQAVLERHLYPTLGTTRARDVVPLDVDRLLVATVARGAPTVANDLLRYLVRLFKYPLVLGWATGNPAASFGSRDAHLRAFRAGERAGHVAAAGAMRAQDGAALGPVERV
ncbi:Arm DNA-binding domain-containing protein [Stenotrophomonas maltophilia]|uniref:Arm DNA-binding domain-containing protein n=1 Tax=Stenotrophomonas maltophilia TaxID=40324 RepID=UPI001639B7A7|nr:Arm DNA-binding domain-containing protein [Stenotrophomonas maltophilia]